MRIARTAVLALLALAAAPPALAADPPPVVSAVSPDHGLVDGGYAVTITGENFTEPMLVAFGGAEALGVTVVSPTEIQVQAPPHARGTVDVVVTRPTVPPAVSDPPGSFSYEEVPGRVWVPRAPGSATGGNPGGLDVTLVDVPNRRVDASLDLNPEDALLPTDDDWRVTQVLFSADGAWAFLATAGVPGTSDSRRLFVVKTARLLGAEGGDPVVAAMDTGGNPYQVALSADGKTLYAADGGSWKDSSTALPDGTFAAWDVTDPAVPVAKGTPVTLGILPVLAYDTTAYRQWGRNSSFPGTLQVKGGRTVVTNVGSHTLSVVALTGPAVADTVSAAVGTGLLEISVSLSSPYTDAFSFVQTTDVLTGISGYHVLRTDSGDLLEQGTIPQPVQFFSLLAGVDLGNPQNLDLGDLDLTLETRTAWPHPDGASLVLPPVVGPAVATWNPATGGISSSTTIPGDGAPRGLALNDASGLFYARRNTGGWTVLSVPDSRGAAPVAVKQVEDLTGIDSLRVVGDGSEMAGTAESALAVIDGAPGSPTAHTVIDTVTLPLDPDGGALFPQPDANGPPPRTFVTIAPPGAGPQILLPLTGSIFCAEEDLPAFEFSAAGSDGRPLELELGSEPDFLRAPGTVRVRVRIPRDADTLSPPRSRWRKVLRGSAGAFVNPFWARVNVRTQGGGRIYGQATQFGVCPPDPARPSAPADAAGASAGAPPAFSFDPGEGGGRHWIEFAGPGGFGSKPLARLRVQDPAAASPSRSLWRRVAKKAAKGGAGYPTTVRWRVRTLDLLGREVFSAERSLTVSR